MNSSKYVVFEGIGHRASQEISEQDYKKAVEMKEIVSKAFEIEETFSIAAHAYIEVEKALMVAALEWSLEDTDLNSHTGYFDRHSQIINLKLISLMTTGRAYADTMEKLAKRNGIEGLNWATYAPLRGEVYDTSLSYRIMDSLRNFVVHEKLPISGFTVGQTSQTESGRLDERKPFRLRVTCSPHITTAPLLGSEMKKKVKAEIEKLGVKGLDVKFLSRGYIEGLFALHKIVRELTATALNEALEFLQNLELRLAEEKEPHGGLAYVGVKNAGIAEATFIGSERLSRIQDKRKSWLKLENARRIFVSTEATLRDEISLVEQHDIWVEK